MSSATYAAPLLPPTPPPRERVLRDLLRQSGRGIVPIRKTFVQIGRGSSTRPGPLAGLVRRHDARGLDAYLLVHALASGGDYSCEYPAAVWARALGFDESATGSAALGAVSKVMKRLDEDHRLIARTRRRRRAVVTLLEEDGSGEEYRHPHKLNEQWLRLPHAYWLDGHHDRLSLPAKAILLIALSLNDGFILPVEKAPQWYGLSADTATRGLQELRDARLLSVAISWDLNYRSSTFHVEKRKYTLTGAFSKAEQERAANARAVKEKQKGSV